MKAAGKWAKSVHLLFNLGVIGKGIDGVLETVGGFLLLIVDPGKLHHFVRVLTQHELSQDPHDLIANFLLNSTSHLSAGAQIFAAIYLLWHGAVKVVIVWALLLRKRWAYPVAIIAFGLFLIYQFYRYFHTYSMTLLILSILDIFVILLTWLEYKRLISNKYFQ